MKSSFFGVLFCSLFATAAAAQDRSFVLDYSAPSACFTSEQFQDEVAARLGRIPFASRGDMLTVTIVEQKKGFLGTLELAGGERILRNADCPTLVRDLAAALAVQLDPTPRGGDTYLEHGTIKEPEAASGDEAEKVHVTITSQQEGIVLHRIRGQQYGMGTVGGHAAAVFGYDFEALCTAPCEVELAPNDYHFAVGAGVGIPIPLDNRVRIKDPVNAELGYKSRRWVRFAGFMTILAGSAVGLGLGMKGLFDDDTTKMITGFSIAGAGSLVGISLSFVGDKVSLELTPAP